MRYQNQNDIIKLGENMKIETLVVGELQTNCYIVTKNNQTIVIDPGDEAEKIIKHCHNKKVVGILVTHHHFDHIGALEEIEKYYGIKHNHLPPDNFNYQIIENKGHSKDSISFYFEKEKILFGGDFIFFHSIGRCDLKGGSTNEMIKSIEKIMTYPKALKIYPGHGPSTTLQEEIPYLNYYKKKISQC